MRVPASWVRASSLPATAITSSRPSSRTTLITATPKPASCVTPSAIVCNASREVSYHPPGWAGAWLELGVMPGHLNSLFPVV